MGYIHYWSYRPACADNRAAWPQILREMTRIVERLGETVDIARSDGAGPPLVDDAGVTFRHPMNRQALRGIRGFARKPTPAHDAAQASEQIRPPTPGTAS